MSVSPSSFHTAVPYMSSQSTQLENSLVEDGDVKSYRSARVLPYELRHHCLVYIEEQLYTCAMNLLNNLLVSGNSYPIPAPPAYAPPPAHIAIANTLLVHPNHTTRASSSDRLAVSSRSYILLRNILSILGPVNANLGEAFEFKSSRSSRRNRYSQREGSESGSASDDEAISSEIANEGSLWTKAQDFWHVVGWGFNCSIRHPKRWEYWRTWLEFMIDVLEDDWKERLRMDEDDEEYIERLTRDSDAESDHKNLKNCLLLKYMCERGNRSMAIKRVVKSLFADGSIENLRLYPEVFQNEAREAPGPNGIKRKRETEVNVDKEKYGDYFEDDSLEPVGSTFDSSYEPQHTPPLSDEDDGFPRRKSQPPSKLAMGGPEAVALRLRLFSLLSRACDQFPTSFCGIPELYELFYDNIRPLPVSEFSLFISPSSRPHLLPTQLSSITQLHLRRLIASNAPDPMLSDDGLNQEVLEVCYLPYPANTSSLEDNVKVSICVETLFRLFVTNCAVEPSVELKGAIETGILAREKRIIDRRKKTSLRSEEEIASREVMKTCGQRMRWLFEVLEKREESA